MVQVPPRMSLDSQQKIGIVGFEVLGGESGASDASRRFLEAIQEGQPGVAVVELGSAEKILGDVGKTSLDRDALREIGKKYDVDTLIVGAITMKESAPKVDVNLSHGLKTGSFDARVSLDGNLNAKIVNTERGATIWSGSSARRIQLAGVSGSNGGGGYGSVHVSERERQVEQLVVDMVEEASRDFRPTWERRAAQ
jgi:hypothetical protein